MSEPISTGSARNSSNVNGGREADTAATSVSPLEAAKHRLLDPRTIAEERSPGTWESLEGLKRDVAEALSRLPTDIKELSARHDVLVKERDALKVEERYFTRESLKRWSSVASRFHRLFGGDPILDGLREKTDERSKEVAEKSAAISCVDRELMEARRQLDALPEPDREIARFSAEMLKTPLSSAEKVELLRPEVLAALSLEEYARVWRRVTPYFVAHVTRQGIRDHNAMFYHSAGMREFHDGFGEILRHGGELRAPRAIHHKLDPTSRESIERFLRDNGVFAEPTLEAARERFAALVHHTLASAPKYPDSGAVHFAAQTVLDAYYGAESGNEIFVIYPSDFIASQYCFAFNGWQADFTRPQSEDKWNDVFVWDQERTSTALPLDAGVVFLPRSTMVDRVTGSRYALVAREALGEIQYSPARHPDFDKRFADWCQSIPAEGDFARAAHHAATSANRRIAARDPRESRDVMRQMEESFDSLKLAIRTTLQELRAPADIAEQMYERLLRQVQDMRFKLSYEERTGSDSSSISFDEFTTKSMLNYLRPAIDPIPAMEYWEARFDRESDIRPRHIVYYDGNPTDAVAKFLEDHDISPVGSFRDGSDTLSSEERLLGFSARHVTDMENDTRANRGLGDLTRIGHELIVDWFQRGQDANGREVGNS